MAGLTGLLNSDPVFIMEQAQQVKSWYGVTAEIAVENNLWHLVKVGGVALHHPPLVNLVLRRGMPRWERLYLSFLHEFGHLQTIPVAIFHLLWLGRYGRVKKRGVRGSLAVLAAAAVAHQAVWELASESYVIVKSGRQYGRIYRKHPNLPGQLLFWIGMSVPAVGFRLWIIGIKR